MGSDVHELAESRHELPPAVELDAPITEFVDRLLATNERQVPVRKNGEVLGFFSVTDVVRAIARRVVTLDVSVADVYSDTVDTVHVGTPLPAAVRQITNASEPSAIVLDEDEAVVGILTEGDIVDAARFTQGELRPASDLAHRGDERQWNEIDLEVDDAIPTLSIELPTVPVSEISTDDVPTVPVDGNVADAAQIMISRDVEQVAVQREDQVVGVVRDRDLLHALVDRRRDD